MQSKSSDRLLLFTLFFTAHWFFGNLYEELVIVPNQLADTTIALGHWQAFFKFSNPMYYYVPLTQLAILIIWYLYFRASSDDEKNWLGKASLFGLLSILITVAIVTQINLKLFFGNLSEYQDQELYKLSVIWLIGNLIRIFFVGNTFYYLHKVYSLRISKNCASIG